MPLTKRKSANVAAKNAVVQRVNVIAALPLVSVRVAVRKPSQNIVVPCIQRLQVKNPANAQNVAWI
jgi:hypothetical protein